jgi:hypothetical protein
MKEGREAEEIKIEIWSSQFQTAVTFDRKLRLRCVMRSQKSYDEIYMVNHLGHYGNFHGQKILS